MTCPSGTQICIINGGGGGPAWWLTALQITIPAVAVVIAAILTQTISARRSREREHAAAQALIQRETARELADRAQRVWQKFIEFDGQPPESLEPVRPFLGDQASLSSLSYRLDHEETGEAVRTWIKNSQAKLVERIQQRNRPMPSAEWERLKDAHDAIQQQLGVIYRNPALRSP